MAIALNDRDLYEIYGNNQQSDHLQQCGLTSTYKPLPQAIGQGGERTFQLRDGLFIDIRDCVLQQDLHLKREHDHNFPLTAKFFLSGGSRVCSQYADTKNGLEQDYEEVSGHHYLYCLPEITEIEEWPSLKKIQMVTVYAHLDYFHQFSDAMTIAPIKHFNEFSAAQPFHHALGCITTPMIKILKQILDCPYQGLIQNLYLESKSLELFTLQFAQFSDFSHNPRPLAKLYPDDIDRLHHAATLLTNQLSNPPSLKALARQVGLNDRKLKQGFLQVFGTTVFGYLHDYRLERSQQLLASGQFSVTEVAHRVGYSSLPSFSKAFRKKFGTSPIVHRLGKYSALR